MFEREIRTDVKIIAFEVDGVFYKAKYFVDGQPLKSLVWQQGDTTYVSNGGRQNLWRYNFTSNDIANFNEFLRLDNQGVEKITLDEYLAKNGYGSPVDDYMIDKLKLPHGQTQRQRKEMINEAAQSTEKYHNRRNKLIAEYNEKVKRGEIIPKSKIEILIKLWDIPTIPRFKQQDVCLKST